MKNINKKVDSLSRLNIIRTKRKSGRSTNFLKWNILTNKKGNGSSMSTPKMGSWIFLLEKGDVEKGESICKYSWTCRTLFYTHIINSIRPKKIVALPRSPPYFFSLIWPPRFFSCFQPILAYIHVLLVTDRSSNFFCIWFLFFCHSFIQWVF